MTPSEAARFLEFVRGHRLYPLFHLRLMSRLRPSELLGLRWKDIHLPGEFVQVRQNAVDVGGRMELSTPKTKASRRTVTISPDTVVTLEAHHERQARECEALEHPTPDTLQQPLVKERTHFENKFVFASEVGTVTSYHNLRRAFKPLIAQLVIQG